jgi:hypothetical protein
VCHQALSLSLLRCPASLPAVLYPYTIDYHLYKQYGELNMVIACVFWLPLLKVVLVLSPNGAGEALFFIESQICSLY